MIHMPISVKRMTSAAVDAIAKPVIERTIKLVKKLLDESSYTVDDIDYVFMAGGSSKLNGVRESLERVFGSEKVKCDTDDLCEAAIAKGAALVGVIKGLPVDPVPKSHIDPTVPEPPIRATPHCRIINHLILTRHLYHHTPLVEYILKHLYMYPRTRVFGSWDITQTYHRPYAHICMHMHSYGYTCVHMHADARPLPHPRLTLHAYACMCIHMYPYACRCVHMHTH